MRALTFEVGEKVYVNISPLKGVIRFNKTGKLNPRYVAPFEILKKLSTLASQLALPPKLSRIHVVLHISQLRRYISDPRHVLAMKPLIVQENL